MFTQHDLNVGTAVVKNLLKGRLSLVFCGAVAGVAAFSSVYLAVQGTDSNTAGLEVLPASKDLGAICQGDHPVEFVIKNNSRGLVTFEHVLASCDCTEAVIREKRLLRGESTLLTAKWNTKGMRGRMSTEIKVGYQDEGTGQSHIAFATITGTVEPSFDYSPKTLNLNRSADSTSEVRLKSSAGLSKSVEILSCSSSHPAIKASRVGVDAFSVEFDPLLWMHDSTLRAQLTLETNEPTNQRIVIPVTVLMD